MAQDFRAIITGEVDLNKAEQEFARFKQRIENDSIKIKFDLNGLNTQFNNLQRQFTNIGNNIGSAMGMSIANNIANTKVSRTAMKNIFNGFDIDNGSIMSYLGADAQLAREFREELEAINKEGGILRGFKFTDSGKSFEAIIQNAHTTITVLGHLKDKIQEINGKSVVVGKEWSGLETKSYVTDFTNDIKQAQQSAKKLYDDVNNVVKAFSNGDFSAKTATMAKELSEVSDTVNDALVQKAKTAADEYKRITDQIATSLQNPNASNALQGQALVDAFTDAEGAAKRYGNAMKEVRADTTKMFAEGANFRAANEVESWAKKNSKALEKYGAQLEQLKQQMRNASSAGELKDLQNQFKNLKAEANALGLTGLSFGDQFKRAFSRIAEFTGIYAFTTKVRQALVEMPKEVIKIDTAMTELRKVSTATATELSNYFETAADSANKYGQSIDKIIDSTASWTRLGYNLEDASTLTDVTAELAQVGSGLNTETATEGLQATIRGFGLAADEAKRVGDMINYIADTQPIDALGIINGLERSSAVLRETNNTLEESIGLITATTSVTQDATSAGTAWRTKFKKRNCANVQKCA